MRVLKTLLGTTALVFGLGLGLAMAPAAQSQVVVSVGIQPVCSYGYYDYAPYACSPMGFYGPGYFYNGIFLGMGPWAGWGYGHGWGSHRFVEAGGGSYRGGGGAAAARGHYGGAQAVRSGGVNHNNDRAVRNNDRAVNAGGARPSAGHVQTRPASASHPVTNATAPHAAVPHGNGGAHPEGSAHPGGARPGAEHK